MASPFTVGFTGIGDLSLSFLSALVRGTDEGKPVKASANGTVALCSDGDQFLGIVSAIDAADKLATVKVRGFVTVPYSGTMPTVGQGTLVADTSGGVKGASDAVGKKLYYVVSVAPDSPNTTGTIVILL